MEVSGIVDDRFEIDRLAGRGGMGAVYRAWDRQTGTVVALKVLHGDSEEHVARFARESRLLSQLNHPGIVRFVAEGTLPDGDAYLVMEWLEGESLERRLNRSLMTVGETITMATGAAAALGAAHERGVTHRDLKPGNIFLVDGSERRAKVVDFGIARVTDTARALTATEQMLGTPGYMSPEQMRASRAASPATDVYALGCVIFKALTGRTPFVGTSSLDVMLQAASGTAPPLSTVRSDVPAELDHLVAAMLATDPDARPQSGLRVAEALAAVATARQAAGAQSWRPPAPLGAATVAQGPATVHSGAEAPPDHDAPPGGTAPYGAAGPQPYPAPPPGTNTPWVAPQRLPPPGPPDAARNLTPLLLALGGLAALGLMALATWWYVAGSKPSRTAPREPPVAGPPTDPMGSAGPQLGGSFPCSDEYCESVTYANRKQVSYDALFARAKREALQRVPKAKLLTIVVGQYRGAHVDLTGPQPVASFEYTARPDQLIRVTFVESMLVVEREPMRDIHPAPEPACSAEAVWRAAVARGFALDDLLSLNYAHKDWGDPGTRPLWLVSSPAKSRWAMFDGTTCEVAKDDARPGRPATAGPPRRVPPDLGRPKGNDQPPRPGIKPGDDLFWTR